MKLDDPLRVIRHGDEFHAGGPVVMRDVQIVPLKKAWAGNFDDLRGKHVVISGRLFGSDNANHVRLVLINPDTIRPGGRIACDGSEVPAKR